MLTFVRRILLGVLCSVCVALFGQSDQIELNTGDEAPDFTLPGSDGKEYSLSELLKDGPVVLAWFPKADTPGCTAQCKSITKSGHLLQEYNVSYFMISVDSPEDNQKFAEKYAADFAILSDEDTTVAEQYGVLSSSGYPSRHTFYIGKDQKILQVDRNVKTATAAEDMVAILAELEVEKVDSEETITPET